MASGIATMAARLTAAGVTRVVLEANGEDRAQDVVRKILVIANGPAKADVAYSPA